MVICNIHLSRAPPDKCTTRRCNRKYHHTFLFMHNLWHLLQQHAVNQQRNSWLLLVSKHTHLYPGYLFNVITYELRVVFLCWSRDPWTRCNKTASTYLPTDPMHNARCTRHFTTSCKYMFISAENHLLVLSSFVLQQQSNKRKWIHVHLLENTKKKRNSDASLLQLRHNVLPTY